MEIQIIETKTVNKEISLPYYFMCKDKYYKIINKDICIEVNPSPTYLLVNVKGTWLLTSELSTGKEISEEQFNKVFLKAINQLYEAAGWPIALIDNAQLHSDVQPV